MKTYLPILLALATAVFWGLYGPALGNARFGSPDQSPFRPYVAIGLAYLVLGILGGLLGMWYRGDAFTFGGISSLWGLAAGALGALGALTLTLAMFTGGARFPYIVMPIVFGGAVTVAALVPLLSARTRVETSPMLWIGIAGIAVCIVLVAANTPHPTPPGGHGEAASAGSAPEVGGGEPQKAGR